MMNQDWPAVFRPFDSVILASRSPRRRDILSAHGVTFTVHASDAPEDLPEGIRPEEAVTLLAERKAAAAAALPEVREIPGSSLLLASDTVVAHGGEILGKPADREDAFRMLRRIRNDRHIVATGVALLFLRDGEIIRRHAFSEITKVFVKDYSDEEIAAYIEAEPPFDKAGSYAIQGLFGKYIDRIEGDYENVVGLPYQRIVRELEQLAL